MTLLQSLVAYTPGNIDSSFGQGKKKEKKRKMIEDKKIEGV
jgi:hypothetical protein